MSKNNNPAKTWKYVLNNYTEKDIEWFKELECNKHVCSKEIGDKGTPHLQGGITFKRAMRLTALKKLHNKVHWEPAIVNDFNYERKIDSERIIDINNTNQGKRNDIDEVVDMIKQGKSEKDICNDYMKAYILRFNGIKKAILMNLPLRDWEMNVHIRWGEPGTGKTKYVWETHGINNVYPKPKNKWWDYYSGQEVILIDDFDPDHTHDMVFDFWLTLMDRYPMYVEYKGGTISMCSKTIYITSNFDPNTWFKGRKNREAFFRRVVTVTEVRDR